MKITKRQLRRIIKEERRKLVEYSDYASHDDLADSFDDIAEMIEDVVMKYVESGWLEHEQDQGSLARDIENLFKMATSLAVTFNSITGR
tara:strand:+ start:60 stop:326 length:267 start_codon:yes stop_codon:yes gene_type:complete